MKNRVWADIVRIGFSALRRSSGIAATGVALQGTPRFFAVVGTLRV